MTHHIWVDLDGVLADFAAGMRQIWPAWEEGRGDVDKAYDNETFARIRTYQEQYPFWFHLPLMPDALVLWEYLKPHSPTILSAAGDPDLRAIGQKHAWVWKHFGTEVQVCCVRKSRDKAEMVRRAGIFRDVLIDDREKALAPWREAGGVGILHRNAAETIRQLHALGIEGVP